MGDMTTPDFDDLLAAFDIPDLDPKDSMDSGQEEASAKPAGKTAAGEAQEVPADEPTVSVIVKNSLSPRSCDAAPAASAATAPPVPSRGKEAPHYQATPLPNGIEAPAGSRSPRPASPASDCEGWTGTRDGEGDGAGGPASSATPSPPHPAVKSDEQSDEEEEEEEDEAGGRSPRSPLFPSGPGPEGQTQGEERPPSPTGQCRAAEDERGGAMGTAGSSPPSTSSSSEEEEEEDLMEMMEAGDDDDEDEDEKQLDVESEVEMEEQSSEEPGGVAGDGSGNDPPPAAPAAAPATPETPRPAPSPCPAPVPSPSGPIPADCAAAKGSPRPFPSPPLLGRQIKREPESPASVSSNESSSSSRPLKVRIKTIKTSGGGIMRTVTRVPSDAAQPTADTDGDTDSGEVKEEGQRGPGAGKGGEVISLQLLNGAVVKGTVLPSSAFHTASTAMLMAASIAQKATLPATTATAAPATPGKTVSKSVHLASLNLVPQTVPSKPAAPGKVAAAAAAGTGAAPRNQTPLVEAFHKLLNGKNPLPTYKPNLNPPADSCLALPPSGYRCLECGDSFALERSLARHYDRRSIRIDVTCNHCARRMAFFNRCSLMLHAREHKDKGLVMQCSNLVMKPIALEQMVGQPDVAGVPLPNASGNASGSARAEHPSPVLPPYPDPALVECDTFSCNECGLQLPDRLALAAHFQLCTPSTAPQVCQLCQMLLPSKCSYVAHYRLHKSKSPYICPECGGVCRAAHIQAHVKDVCFHFTRKVGYKCPQCGVVYGGVTSVKSHIQDVHCEAFHKCPICPMAFKSAPSAHSHIYTQHPGISNQQAKVIHKCAMCDTVFTHQPLLNTHFDQHLTKQRVSVFKCPQCPVLFAQKRTMVEHVKTNHSSGRSEEASESRPAAATTPAAATETAAAAAAAAETPEPEPSPKPSADSTDSPTDESSSSPKAVLSLQRRKEMRLKLKNAGWTCGQCQTWFPEREEYITHMKKDHGKAMKKFPCRLCERSFCSAPSLRRHVRVNHEGIKRVYSCRHCIEGKRTFSSRLTLEKHLQVIHSINLADHVQDQENLFERVSIKTSIRKRGGALERWGSDPAKRRRGGGGGSPPYRCMKCGYTTGSFADFHQHIPQHRTGSSSYQCRQCGLCFAARPSLGRHLFIVHGVKESESAVLAEQAADTDAAQLGGGHVICDVCGKTFDNEPLLKTHFRTHGMAFIKAKQNGLDK